MPQFDTFIFSSTIFYFIVSFLLLLYVNHNYILPKYGALLKLRAKMLIKQFFDFLTRVKAFFSVQLSRV